MSSFLPQFDIRAAFSIEVFIGRTVALHNEFRIDARSDALLGGMYQFLDSCPYRGHLHEPKAIVIMKAGTSGTVSLSLAIDILAIVRLQL
jgi:hypothetical protein